MRLSTLLSELVTAETALAVLVVVWFLVLGIVQLAHRTPPRRAAPPRWVTVSRRVRGALTIVGAAGVGAGLAVPGVGLAAGIVLAALSVWNTIEAALPPTKVGRVIVAVLSFALAIFFVGFRG